MLGELSTSLDVDIARLGWEGQSPFSDLTRAWRTSPQHRYGMRMTPVGQNRAQLDRAGAVSGSKNNRLQLPYSQEIGSVNKYRISVYADKLGRSNVHFGKTADSVSKSQPHHINCSLVTGELKLNFYQWFI